MTNIKAPRKAKTKTSETTNSRRSKEPKEPINRKKQLLELIQQRSELKAKSEKQKELMKMIADSKKQIIIASGPAGCGKTLVTLSECLYLLMGDTNKFDELLIFKSVTPLRGEEVGYLPGDIGEKMKYFLMSYFIQMEKIIGKTKLEKMINEEFLKLVPLGFIRGVSMSPNQIIIVDEFQNISIDNAKTILTRMEEGAKLICLGDIRQQDSKGKNGLSFLVDNFKDVDDKIGIIEFNEGEIVRNPLITKILKVFEDNGH